MYGLRTSARPGQDSGPLRDPSTPIPPWLYDNQGTRAATGNHDDGMTIEELCALPDGSSPLPMPHLHLWTTNGFLFECPKLIAAWGFEFGPTSSGQAADGPRQLLAERSRADADGGFAAARALCRQVLEAGSNATAVSTAPSPSRCGAAIERASPGPLSGAVRPLGRRAAGPSGATRSLADFCTMTCGRSRKCRLAQSSRKAGTCQRGLRLSAATDGGRGGGGRRQAGDARDGPDLSEPAKAGRGSKGF